MTAHDETVDDGHRLLRLSTERDPARKRPLRYTVCECGWHSQRVGGRTRARTLHYAHRFGEWPEG